MHNYLVNSDELISESLKGALKGRGLTLNVGRWGKGITRYPRGPLGLSGASALHYIAFSVLISLNYFGKASPNLEHSSRS